MLSKFICLYVAVVLVRGAPPISVVPLEKQQPTVIAIVAQSEELESNGTLKFSYETANGIKREETSYDKVLPKGKSSASSNEAVEDKDDESNEIHVQRGSYSYTAPDGSVISVSYIADENGFRPIGDHLPKAPALLEAATSRASKNNAGDNAEDGSEPAAAVVEAPAKDSIKPDVQNKTDSNEKESKIADQHLDHVYTARPENSSSNSVEPSTNSGETSTTQEVSSTTTEIPSITTNQSSTTQAESSSTSKIPSTSTDKSSTAQKESYTTTEIPSITTDQSSTTQGEPSTTTEIPSTTPEKSSTAQESSTTTKTPSKTAEVISTSEISSTPEAASTELASPNTSDVTSSEVTSTTDQVSSKATSSEETSTPAATHNDALPDSTPTRNTEATTDASTPV